MTSGRSRGTARRIGQRPADRGQIGRAGRPVKEAQSVEEYRRGQDAEEEVFGRRLLASGVAPAQVEEDIRGNGDHFQADEEQHEVAGDGREHQPGDCQEQRAESLGRAAGGERPPIQQQQDRAEGQGQRAAVGGQRIGQERSAGDRAPRPQRHKAAAAAAIAPPASHRHSPGEARNVPAK